MQPGVAPPSGMPPSPGQGPNQPHMGISQQGANQPQMGISQQPQPGKQLFEIFEILNSINRKFI